MTGVCRDIFKAIHEGKWLSIEYRNQADKVTRYWIGIHGIDPVRKLMRVEGLHLGELQTATLLIYIDSILSSTVLEGTYFPVNQGLVDDIAIHPEKYTGIFDNIPNLKILNYLSDCNKLDATPYSADYALIHHFDGDVFTGGSYALSDSQFEEIVRYFQYKSTEEEAELKIKQLGLNIMSVHTREGLYVLAYRIMRCDSDSGKKLIKSMVLRTADRQGMC